MPAGAQCYGKVYAFLSVGTMLQVSIRKTDVVNAESFFFSSKALVVFIVDPYGRRVKFKIKSEADEFGNFYIKTWGVYRGRSSATYRLPSAFGTLEELYGIVGHQAHFVIRNLLQRDHFILSRLKQFQTEG